MTNIVSSFIPFPNITWWANVMDVPMLLLDKDEHFQKMSYRNRYNISGANGSILLSIPVEKGRNQRTAMKDVVIAPGNWQVQHWRTIISVYGRSPYFEFYAPLLQPIFEQPFKYLLDFNLASIEWVEKYLKITIPKTYSEAYIETYDNTIDLRNMSAKAADNCAIIFPEYYQVFSDRTGFMPNLSILDLLFSEGPATAEWIRQNRDKLQSGF